MKVAIRVTPVGKQKHLPPFPYQNSPNVPVHIIVQLLEIRCPKETTTGSVILIMYLPHKDDGKSGLATDSTCFTVVSLSHRNSVYPPTSACTVVPDKQTKPSTTDDFFIFIFFLRQQCI